MNLNQFLGELAQRGIKLWLEGDTLRFRAPKGVMTSEDRDLLVLHKAKVISLLSQSNTTANDTDQTIVPISEKREIPLSFPQEQLWFLNQLDPNNVSYNELFPLRFLGVLNIVVLEQSLNKIVARHAALRTNFATVNGQPVQVIAESLILTVPVIDLSNLPDSDRENEVQRLATEQAQKPFDLVSDPLIQATLLKLTETEHIFLLRTHHIVWDGWSLGIMWRELAAFYNDLSQELPPLPAQYPDFAVWQRQDLTGEVLDSLQTYWQEQLLNAPPLLELPTDRARRVTQTFRGKHYRFVISKPLTEALSGLSRRQKVTLFMTLLAAFQTLLYRYTGQDDIVVGSPIANRDRAEFKDLIGYFVNTLVLRTCLAGNPSFEDLLSRVRKVTLGAYAHRELPFEKLVEILQPERSLSYTPLFQVMFMLLDELPEIKMEGLKVSPLAVETGITHFDLALFIEKTSSGLIGEWEYNTDLFDDATIARMTGHFQTLLEGIVANPKAQVSELPLLTETKRHQLLVEWNNTTREYPQDKCIHQLFEEQVQQTPDAIAVVFEGEQLTYLELNEKANQLAHYLQELAVGPEVLVGICLERSIEMIVGLLGVLKADGAYVPLDPAYPFERLSFMLEDSSVPVLLTQSKLVEKLPPHSARVVYLDSDWETIAFHSKENPSSTVTPDHLAYVIYTSGSTGKPKGVCCCHTGVVNLYTDFQSKQPLSVGYRCSLWTAISFDVSVYEIFSALLAGGALYIVSNNVRSDTQTFYKWLNFHQIHSAYIPPFMLNQLSEMVLQGADKFALRRLLVGVEPIPARLLALLSKGIPGLHIINGYGPTEATICATLYSVSSFEVRSSNTPIGKPVLNTKIYLLNEQMQPVPIGVPGELHIGGVGLARGYLNRPDLTEQKFIPNPFSDEPNSRLYKTGDLARYLPDGNIEFIGRIDNQVKIRGFRIELGEIEAAIAQHPEVRETVVLAKDDQPDNKRLVAYVVANHKPPATSELRHFLFQKLPDYMVPGAFVMLSSLPLTPNGKVDRRALAALDTEASDSISFVPPRDTVEQQLQRIWSEVLQLPTVGVKDNFFTLGGHSLLAVLLMAHISRHFGKNLPIATLFSSPTIEQLASCLRLETHSKPWSPLVAIQKGGDKRPFFCVPGVGGNVIYLYDLARHLGSSQPFYGLQARGLDGESEPFTQLEEIASYYIEAIQTVQPTGPYLLGGHSFGGVVAFEMAMMLHKQGQYVALLAMIDSVAPIVGKKSKGIDEDDAAYLTDFASYIGYICSKNLEVSQETLASLTAVEQLHYLKERLIRVNLLPKDAGITSVQGLVQVYKESLKAYRVYLPSGVQQTPITLFRSSEVDVFESDTGELTQRLKEPALGWNEFSSTIDIHVVPGNHMTMMQQPHVQVLAAQLLSYLEQVQA